MSDRSSASREISHGLAAHRGVAFIAMTKLPPYWLPQSEADIQRAISNDWLSETHYLDCKREIGAKADRKETGRDLASFAIDGGALLVGVDEDKANRTFSLAPQQLAGLAEQVENIAGSTIDPALDVITHEIESGRGTGLGYLLVEVRPSPFAPHMVDGVYYGRGDKKRIRLTDPQVRRYHAQRQSVEEQIHALLDEEIARDLVPVEARKRGHLYLVATPVTAPRTTARSLVRDPDERRLNEIVQAAESRMGTSELSQSRPLVTLATRVMRRAHSTALCSRSASGPGRTFLSGNAAAEENLVDIEFRDHGSIRALVGNATYAYREIGDRIDLVIFEPMIVAYAVRLCGWTAALGRAIGYRGTWNLGLHVSGLRNLPGFFAEQGGAYESYFNEDYHRAVTVASLADLEDRWQSIVGELVGGLFHALKTPPQSFAEVVTF
jgi:hypothetical protein